MEGECKIGPTLALVNKGEEGERNIAYKLRRKEANK